MVTEYSLKSLEDHGKRIAKKLGGEGSGNFGHEGRPGERGGSGPSGFSQGDLVEYRGEKGRVTGFSGNVVEIEYMKGGNAKVSHNNPDLKTTAKISDKSVAQRVAAKVTPKQSQLDKNFKKGMAQSFGWKGTAGQK